MLQIVLCLIQGLGMLSIIEFAVQIVFGLEFVVTESLIPKVGTFVKETKEFVFDGIIHG
jgi:hypothetical protein